MSRKDYQLIARVIAKHRPYDPENYTDLSTQWLNIRDEFIADLKQDNPRFDHKIFIDACKQ